MKNLIEIAAAAGHRCHRLGFATTRTARTLALVALLLATAWPSNAEALVVQWGENGDVPLPSDYDGDGKADIAIWRPSTATWWIVQSTTNTQRVVQWGEPDDVPVAADYDADYKADIAIWRPSTGTWWIVQSTTNTQRVVQWGEPGDIPLPGSHDMYPGADFAVWRPSTRTWFTYGSSPSGSWTAQVFDTTPGDIPLVATWCLWDGPRISFWNTISGNWTVSWPSPSSTTQWGQPGDVPVPARYDGLSKAKKAVFRPSDGTWWILDTPEPEACIG